jgi:hypothetical protein
MPLYRIHHLQKNGRTRPGEYFEAADDNEAIELVRLRLEKTDCELTRGDRRLALIPSGGGVPIPSARAHAHFAVI